MFESDLVLWLQSAESSVMTTLMSLVTEAGSMEFVVVAAIVVAFGIDLRIGALLFVMLFWNDVLTDLFKGCFALPRPAHVDTAIQNFGGEPIEPPPFPAAGGEEFFDLPEEEAIEYYRARGGISFGFPSGHVGMATTLWVGIALMLRSHLLGIITAVLVPAVMISRMYLGKHFLADVIGGLVLALAIVWAGHKFLRSGTLGEFTAPWRWSPTSRSRPVIAGALLLLPMFLLAVEWTARFDKTGRLAGATVAFLLLAYFGFPEVRARITKRAIWVLFALLLFSATHLAGEAMLGIDSTTRSFTGQFLFGFLPPLVCLLGTVGLRSFFRPFALHPPRRPQESLEQS
ncbi:phosphatase PAP2 family protein [soil metagenome]